jgi:hypothetical protein
MSLQSRFHRAFDQMRVCFRKSHPRVKGVTYEIPGGAGSTLRLQVGVAVAGWEEADGLDDRQGIEDVIQRCLEEEGLPAPTEVRIAAHEALGGASIHRYFFAPAAKT